MIARLAVAAALAGSAAGAAVVLADEPAPPSTVPAAKTAVPSPQPTVEPTEARNPRIVLEAPDPKGAAPWAVREFETTFTSRKGKKTDATCRELGRLRDGAFGWIGGDGTFAPTRPGHHQNPADCPTAKMLDAIEATISRFATVVTPPGGSPQPDRTVTWGFARPQIVSIALPGEPPIPTKGLYLHVGTGRVPAPPVRRTLERADGTRRTIDELDQAGFRGERPVPGTSALAAIAPDPAGGRPWGLLVARGERGSTCLASPEQLVGRDYAYVDSRLGVASAGFGGHFNCKRKPPTRAFPLRTESLISGADPSEASGRVERRTLDGRIVFSGIVHPDVVSVTITTPHDVRTLIPDPEHHALVTVYAGRFPGGEATATARFKDGRTVTRSLYVE